MSLFPDQIQALADYDAAISAGARSPIIAAATGFGKTHAAAERIQRIVAGGGRVWFLAHLGELLEDTSKRLRARGIRHGWIWASRPTDPGAACQLVSVATAAARLDALGHQPDLVIIDECHRATSRSYQDVLNALGRPQVMGLSGSSMRPDGLSMRSGGFDALIRTPDTIDLIDAGRLSPLRAWSWPEPPELAAVGRRGRDFDQVAAGDVMSRPTMLGNSLSHWEERCRTGGAIRPTVIFSSSVKAANASAEAWRRAGFRAMAVDGTSSRYDRRNAIQWMRGGDLDALVCADLYIAGLDLPDLGCVLCERKTDSLIIWLQMVGRGLRKSTVWPDCYLLDPVGNCRRPGIGDPLARRMHLWSLDDGNDRRLKEAVPPVSVCGRCFSTAMVGNRCSEPGCGWEKKVSLLQDYIIQQGRLEEIKLGKAQAAEEKAGLVRKRLQEEARCLTLKDWVALGTARDYPNPMAWARVRFGIRSRRQPASRARIVL